MYLFFAEALKIDGDIMASLKPTTEKKPITLKPVGFIANEIDKPFLVSGEEGIEMKERMALVKEQVRKIRKMKSTVTIDPEWVEVLEGH